MVRGSEPTGGSPISEFPDERKHRHSARSLAKVVLLRPQDYNSPFVAKIDHHDRLQSEMLRFKTYIEPWQPQLRPELYVHNGTAVIFFTLIDGAGDQRTPAPTLHDRIVSLASGERNRQISNCATFADLMLAITTAAQRLGALNKLDGGAAAIPNLCWIGIEPLIDLKDSGVNFLIKDGNSSLDIIGMAEKATQQVTILNGRGTVHGDIHSRNILLRHDREPLFIDFANSGPGHPIFDMVRLEASILYTHFRMATDEDRVTECLHSLFGGNFPIESLEAAYPELLSSNVSRLCAHASVETRKVALEVLSLFGGSDQDYYHMKYLVACQSLTIADFQVGVVRAAIRAISRLIRQSV